MSHPENHLRFRLLPSLLLVIAAGGIAWGSSVNVPNTFVAGTPAVADEVNANFAACEIAIDDNDARITSNDGRITANEDALGALGQFGLAKVAFHIQSNGTASPTIRFTEGVPGTFAASVIRFTPGTDHFAFNPPVDLADNFVLATVASPAVDAVVNVWPNTIGDPITNMIVYTLDSSGAESDDIDFYLVIF